MTKVTGYCGAPVQFPEQFVDIDRYVDEKGIEYWGKAERQPDGTWHALAVIHGILCAVEVTLSEPKEGPKP